MSRTSKSRLDHSDTKWFITIGVLLALFAGSVILLAKSPQIRVVISPREEAPTPPAPSPVVEAPIPAPEGLPEGGSVELIDVYDEDGFTVEDQRIVWRTENGESTLVESVVTLLPGLKANREKLFIFAKPTNDPRVYFATAANVATESYPSAIIAFDPALRAFIPLLNAQNIPNTEIITSNLSSNQRRLAFVTGVDENKEARELWIYDLPSDSLSRLVSLASSESFTYGLYGFDGTPAFSFKWKDPTIISYEVFRAGDDLDITDIPRKKIATRTVKIEP